MQPRVLTGKPAPRSSRDLVLTALRVRGPMSRAELARYAGVAPSTIMALDETDWLPAVRSRN